MSALYNEVRVFGDTVSVSKIQFINIVPGKQSGRAHWPRIGDESFGLHVFVLVLHLNQCVG